MVQRTTYYGKEKSLIFEHSTKSRTASKTVSSFAGSGDARRVAAGASATLREELAVPAGLPSTSQTASENIKVAYLVELVAKPSRPHKPLSVSVPVLVGSVPLAAPPAHPVEEPRTRKRRKQVSFIGAKIGVTYVLLFILAPPAYDELKN